MNIGSLTLNPTTPSTIQPLRPDPANGDPLQVGRSPQPQLPEPTNQPALPEPPSGDLNRLLDRAAEMKIQFKLFEQDGEGEDKLGFKVRLREEGAKISFKFKREIEEELERGKADDETREASLEIQQSFEMSLQFKLEGLASQPAVSADNVMQNLGSVFGDFLSGLAGLFGSSSLDPAAPAPSAPAAPAPSAPAAPAPVNTDLNAPVTSAPAPAESAPATPATDSVSPSEPQPALPEVVDPTATTTPANPFQDFFDRLTSLFDAFTQDILGLFGAQTESQAPAPADQTPAASPAATPATPAPLQGSFELKISFEARISAYVAPPAAPAVVSAEA